MADNVEITPGTGAAVSTEEVTTLNGLPVAAQHVQRTIPATRTADGTVVDTTLASETKLETVRVLLDAINTNKATEATLAALRDRLPALLATGRLDVNVGASAALDILDRAARQLGIVALDSATLAALENTTVTVANPTANPETGLAKETTLAALRDRLPALLATGRLDVNVGASVALDILDRAARQLGVVALDAASLAALENTTVTVANPTANPETGLSKETTLAALSAKLPALLEAGRLSVRADGTVALDAATLAALENTTVTVGNFPAVQPVSDNGGSLTVDGTVAVSGAIDTELPAAAALTDSLTNPTAPSVGAHGLVWDSASATWDRVRGDAASGMRTRRSSVWYDDTTTALAAAGTFTGTSRDLATAATGTTAHGTTETFRGLSVSDQSGTLHLEVSHNNITWRRIESYPASLKTSSLYVAEGEYKPASRYARWVYVNGATLQGHFMLQTMML